MANTEPTRTIDQIDEDIAAVESTVEKLQAEAQKITDELTFGLEDSALVEAALSGKSPATSAKTAKMEARREEIGNMVRALNARLLRLKRERALAKMAELEERQAAHVKEAEQAQERFDEAQAALEEARNLVYFDGQEAYSLREELRNAEDKLWQIDPSYREEAEAERQRRLEEARAAKAEGMYEHRRRVAAMSGLFQVDSPEQLAALREAAAKQASEIKVLGPNDGRWEDQ